MSLLEIFFALWWVWLPLLVVLFIVSRNNKSKANPAGDDKDLQWHNYIASFQDVVKSKAEKNLIDAILSRKTADQLYEKTDIASEKAPQPELISQPTVSEPADQHEPLPAKPRKTSEPLDNTLLLLYFGAFLLTASAGLFVAIGNLDGVIRTVVLAITTALLYGGGLWIYQNKQKLAQAGVSFMGAAMIITPLIGVAWYNLIAGQENGAIIWLVTSLVCVGLYVHAYSVIRNAFIAYLLIGSFVSSVESVVLTAALPSYVFAWVAIFASLVLQAVSIWRGGSKPLLEASDTSAQLLVPLSIVGSLVLFPNFGSAQLGVTLLLSGGYYALLAWQRPEKITDYSTAAQAAVISGLANITYAFQESFSSVAVLLSGVCVLYIIGIVASKPAASRTYNLVAIGSLAIAGSILFSVMDPWQLVVYSSIALVLSGVVWLKLQSISSLSVGGVILLALPYLIGQYAMDPHASPIMQMLLYSVPAIISGIIAIVACKKASFAQYHNTAVTIYILAAVALIITGWIAGFVPILTASVLLATGFVVLHYVSKANDWWIFASATILIPAIYALIELRTDDTIFSLMVGFAILVNIAISLMTRQQAIRWILVGCILVAPVAVGGGGLGFEWQEAGYAAGYLLAMAGCVLARAIARGKLLVSNKVPLSSYDSAASQAYIAGYVLSAFLAVFISLYDTNSQLVTSLVLGILSATVVYVAYFVESKNEALLLLPILLQGLLFSIIRPDIADSSQLTTAALLSAGLAAALYAATYVLPRTEPEIQRLILTTTVFTSYIGAALVVIEPNDVSEIFPLTLTIAGLLTLYHNRSASRNIFELSAAVILVSINWFLLTFGIDNVHIHTHLVVIFLAIFAYLRYTDHDEEGQKQHVVALFLVATIPMVLQTLNNGEGEMYGLILIIQQVSFMVIGIILNQRFLLKAGLWVALGSILYQLRGLGWAFLAIIAVVIIGIAIYRLQKHNDNQSNNKN